MNELINKLKLFHSEIQVSGSGNYNADMYKFKNLLITNPHIISKIKSFELYSTFDITGVVYVIKNIIYDTQIMPVWTVHNQFELNTAFAYMLQTHYSRIKICIDNSSKFINVENIKNIIEKGIYGAGHEFELSQIALFGYEVTCLFNGDIIIIDFKFSYINNHKEINDLKCFGLDLSKSVFDKNDDDSTKVLKLARWFSEHFEYDNKGKLSDHSAYSLLSQGKGVCQSISALAIIIMECSNNPIRYVTGKGYSGQEWDNHGWNIVKINGRWLYCDFTFSLPYQNTFFSSKYLNRNAIDLRYDHQWNENNYLDAVNDTIFQRRQIYRLSVFSFMLESKLFSANGAIFEFDSGSPLIKINGEEYFALFKFVSFIGGSYEFVANENAIALYLNNNKFNLPISLMLTYNGDRFIKFNNLRNLPCFICCKKNDLYIITVR